MGEDRSAAGLFAASQRHPVESRLTPAMCSRLTTRQPADRAARQPRRYLVIRKGPLSETVQCLGDAPAQSPGSSARPFSRSARRAIAQRFGDSEL